MVLLQLMKVGQEKQEGEEEKDWILKGCTLEIAETDRQKRYELLEGVPFTHGASLISCNTAQK